MKLNPDFIMQEMEAGVSVLVPTGDSSQKFHGIIRLNESAAFIVKALAEETEISNRYAYPEGSTSGFGLRNVDQRIRLYYGQSEGLAIQSGPEGTCVSFRIPQNRREETA